MKHDNTKVDPEKYLHVFQDYLNQMRLKSLIPIPYETAKSEVYLRMVSSFETELEQNLFEQLFNSFHEATDVQTFYDEMENRR